MPLLFLSVGEREPAVSDATLEPFPGFKVVPWLEARVEAEPNAEYEPEFEIAFDMVSARYKLTFIGLRASEVNGTMLRTVRAMDYVKAAARRSIYLVLDESGAQEPLAALFEAELGESMFGAEFAKYIAGGGPDAFAIAHVAFSYIFAQLAAEPPAKAVQRDLGLTPRTADNWIARARAAGLLTPSSESSDPAPQIEAWRVVMSRYEGMIADE